MKNLLSNIWLLILLAVLIALISIAVSISSGKWHWFGRSGAWLTVIGIILSARPLIRMGTDKWIQSKGIINLGSLVPTPNEIENSKQSNLDDSAFQVGIPMSIIGTLIWAYGDLIENFF